VRWWMAVEYHCCEPEFFEHIAIIVVLVLFAGLMSGLTLGLMSLSLVDLEVLAKSGTENDRKHAGMARAALPRPTPWSRSRVGGRAFRAYSIVHSGLWPVWCRVRGG
jgi:hypothetical protein